MKPRRLKSARSVKPATAVRRRVTQETIDQMAALRRQGLTFDEIGVRLGFSERTARRFAGNVKPELHVPQAEADLETNPDPRVLRKRLLSEFTKELYWDEDLRGMTMTIHRPNNWSASVEYGGPPPIEFLSDAERLLSEKLEKIGVHTLRVLVKDERAHHRFMWEVLEPLYRDYVDWFHRFQLDGDLDNAESWRPGMHRPPREEFGEDEFINSRWFE